MKGKSIFLKMSIFLVITLIFAASCDNLGGAKDLIDNVTGTPIRSVSVTVTAPAKNATPSTKATLGTGVNYTCSQVTWSPEHTKFADDVKYTAEVTLTANSGYTFNGLTSAKIVNGGTAVISNNTGRNVTISYEFGEIAVVTRVVTGVAIKNPPDLTEYTHGEPLDLTGLVVTLTYNTEPKLQDVEPAQFAENNITVTPEDGADLSRALNSGITVSCNEIIKTIPLTINKRELTVTGMSHTKVYDGTVNAEDVALTLGNIAAIDGIADDVTASASAAYTSKNALTTDLDPEIFTITLGGDDKDNYTVADPENFNVTGGITQKPLTIIPDSGKTKFYGEPDPAFTYTIKDDEELAPGDSFNTTTLSRAAGENAGFYAINIDTLDCGPNYILSLSGTVNFEIKKALISAANILVTAPVKGNTPVSAATIGSGTGFGVGTVTWSPGDAVFQPSVKYTASVTLTADSNHAFNGELVKYSINGQTATPQNLESPVTITYQFPATRSETIAGIEIINQPAKMVYVYGENLNLSGLKARLTYDDDQYDDVEFADFGTNAISTSLPDGMILTNKDNHGERIIVSIDKYEDSTDPLTVNRRELEIVEIKHSKIYDGTKDADNPFDIEYAGIINDDIVYSGTVYAKYTGEAAGTKTIDIYAIILAGAAEANYCVERLGDAEPNYEGIAPYEDFPVTGGILPKYISVKSAVTKSKVYDGGTALIGDIALILDTDDLIGDDTVEVTAFTATYTNANVGPNSLTVTGIELDNSNYDTDESINGLPTTGVITPRLVTITPNPGGRIYVYNDVPPVITYTPSEAMIDKPENAETGGLIIYDFNAGDHEIFMGDLSWGDNYNLELDTEPVYYTIEQAAGRDAGTPVLESKTVNSITIEEIPRLVNRQYAEYFITSEPDYEFDESEEWTMQLVFDELEPAETYYIYARSQANQNHIKGSPGLPLVVTLPSFTIKFDPVKEALVLPDDPIVISIAGDDFHIELPAGFTDYYWFVNDGSKISGDTPAIIDGIPYIILEANQFSYVDIGLNTLTIEVTNNGIVPYGLTIDFTVTE